jgi:CheY-like chemotaxis protein
MSGDDAICPVCNRRLAKGEPRYRRPDGDVHPRCFEGPRVLVVDDDPHFRQLVIFHVKRGRSCKVETATNGHEALERMRANVYDLILCDLLMPEMDGPTFYRKVQVEHPELASRIVFVTANAARDEYGTFMRGLDVPVLPKPFPKEDLDEILARMMGPSQPPPDTKK